MQEQLNLTIPNGWNQCNPSQLEQIALIMIEQIEKAKADRSVLAQGTSLFDPVLAEIIMRWFCKPHGKIIDPFGGEQTKGVVAGTLGYDYQAVEIRKEQVKNVMGL